MRSWCIPIALSFVSAAQAAPPQRVEILYEVTRNGTPIAEVTERLEHDRLRYRLEETWKGKGILALRGEARRTSRGAIARDGLRPAEFEERRSGREPVRATFDPAERIPALQRQDRLSFLWNFAFLPPGEVTEVRVADGKGVATHVYLRTGREKARTAAGEFDVLKLTRKKEQPGDRTTEIWLATDRFHLPVRILIIEKDGTRMEQAAVRITAR